MALGAAGRAYEMVSPPDKNGADVSNSSGEIAFNLPTTQASPDGDAVGYGVPTAFGDAASNVISGRYVARRSAEGWTSSSTMPPLGTISDTTIQSVFANSEDQSASLVASTRALATGAILGELNVYRRDNRNGSYELIATADERAASDVFGQGGRLFADATPDLGQIVLASRAPLTPDAPRGGCGGQDCLNVYLWNGQHLQLVNYLPDGSLPGAGASPGSVENDFPGLHSPRVISRDGRRVFFTASDDGFRRAIYVREAGVTKAISVSHRSADAGTPHSGSFRAASADGRWVFFASDERLTDDASTPAPEHGNSDLYRYDVESGDLVDLTPMPVGTGPALVSGIPWVSDDGGYVYFIAEGTLAPEAPSEGHKLYVWHAGAVRYVATLDSQYDNTGSNGSDMAGSSNGRYFAFTSVAPVDGSDYRSPACADRNPRGACRQIYVYDAVEQQLSCASCSASPAGDAVLGGRKSSDSGLSHYFPRAVLDDGRVYFDTPDALVPDDVNGRLDVYEFDGAQRRLISSGRSRDDSSFADASVDGRDVFFSTRESLVGIDRDEYVDLYDARVGGGIAAQNPAPPSAPCPAQCRAAFTAPSAPDAPGTAGFFGAGNAAPASARAPAPRVLGARSDRRAVTLRVRVGGRGTLAVRGAAVRASHRTIARAGTYRVRLALTPAARRALARRRSLRAVVRVEFRATGGKASSVRTAVVIRGAGGAR